MKVLKECCNAVCDYTRQNYSIVEFLKSKGLWNETGTIKCPFHPETNPSFRVNAENNVYHCFSCNSKGSYINLLYDYTTKVEERSISFYNCVQEVLNNDTVMQNTLGFTSIFKNEEEIASLDEVVAGVYKPFRPIIVTKKTYQIIFKQLTSLEDKLELFSMIQKGHSVDYCWSVLIDKSIKDNKHSSTDIVSMQDEFDKLFTDEFSDTEF